MTRLYLVRHGRAAARYDQGVDPGLDDVGHEQARAVAADLAPLGPLPIITSPLRRTRETAAPLESEWDTQARVEPAVGEIKSPTDDLAERSAWLGAILRGERTWGDLDDVRLRWRDEVIDALLRLDEHSVVVTHYIAINAAVGVAIGDDRVAHFAPDNCSCTVLETDGSSLSLIELGRQAETTVR